MEEVDERFVLTTKLDWDYTEMGFQSTEEFLLWCYFNRKGNPNYYGSETVIPENND